MEGCISTKFYEHQDFHLKMSSNWLNDTDWTKQLISNIIQISHSQWIYQNIFLHDQNHGYLHKKNTEQMAEEIHRLAELEPEDVPAESRFLLEMNLGDLTKLHVETQAYWITAVTAARSAKARKSAMGAREKRRKIIHSRSNWNVPLLCKMCGCLNATSTGNLGC